MDERPPGTPAAKVSPEIYVYATNKNFLNVYDALRIEKIKIEVAGYDQSSGRQTGIAGAWLDVDDARLLTHLVITRQFREVLEVPGRPARFEKFGGSDRDGAVESRTLQVEWDPADGKFARYPYRITIANGPGQRTQNGAVQPKGEPTTRLSMRLPEADFMKIMLAVSAYIQAYEAAHHHRISAEKMREVQEKLAGRAERRLPLAVGSDDEDRAPAAPTRAGNPPLRVVPNDLSPGPSPTKGGEDSGRVAARPVVRPTYPPTSAAPTVANGSARPVAGPPPSRPAPTGPGRMPTDSSPARLDRATRTG
ncbi:MAG: hypothetical protein M3Z04_09930 [Chloroflexota bacterium]|nr:hypothetical protein [Chloroflexota bacterium]